MPFNGSGTFNLIYNWQNDAAQGLNISSSRMEAQEQDIAAGLSLCITKDGQQTPTASLPMGGFRLTNMGNATAQGNAVSVQDVQNSSVTTLTTVAGTDTITANTAPSIGAYAANQRFQFMPAGANTTNAVTLNINGFGAKNVQKPTPGGLVACAPGDIPAGIEQTVIYDGTQFQLQMAANPFNHGQCRLSVASTTSLKLSPYNGNFLIINGVPWQVPAAGVTVTNGGLAASTLYYVYALISGGALALEVVATTHATGTNGVEQKSGDATRTLVGMVYTNGSTQFVDSTTSRTCLSWFNRESKAFQSTAGGNNTSSTSFTTISAVFNFLAWADEAFFGYVCGYSNNTSTTFNSASLAIDGGLVGQTASANMAASTNVPFSSQYSAFLSEGLHTESLQAAVGAGTGQFQFALGGIVRG